MLKILFVLTVLLLLLALSLRTSSFLYSPQVCYVGGFIIQSVLCLMYANLWGTDLSSETILIILGGAGLYVLVSLLTSKKFKKTKLGKVERKIKIEKWKLLFFITLQTITLVMLILFYRNTVGGNSLGEAIYTFRSMIQGNITQDVNLPGLIGILRGISCAIGYLLAYVLAYNIINKNKENIILYILNVVLSIVNEGMLGARGGIVTFLIGLIMEIALISYKQFNKRVNIKQVMKVVLIGVGVLILFPLVGTIMGRPGVGPSYEVAVYLGAPLHNFNKYIVNNPTVDRIGFSTLYTTIIDIESLFGIDLNSSSQYLKIGWNYANGFSMGNVYTTYAPFYHDGGNFGIIFYVTITAIICQIIYKKAVISRNQDNKRINIHVVLYAYVVGSIFMSFFANEIIPKIFSYYTIKLFIIIYLIKIFIEKVHFKIRTGKANKL